MNRDTFFDFYLNKAENVLKQRNTFLSVYLTTLMLIFIPIVCSLDLSFISVLSCYFDNVAIVIGIIFFLIMLIFAIPFLGYLFWEGKYKEYRNNYMLIAIKSICREEFLKIPGKTANSEDGDAEEIENKDESDSNENFVDIDDLCTLLQEYTLFKRKDIMQILKFISTEEEKS